MAVGWGKEGQSSGRKYPQLLPAVEKLLGFSYSASKFIIVLYSILCLVFVQHKATEEKNNGEMKMVTTLIIAPVQDKTDSRN